MADFLVELKKRVVVGLVGGSDLCKIAEQMAGSKDEGKSLPGYFQFDNNIYCCIPDVYHPFSPGVLFSLSLPLIHFQTILL